MYIVKQKPLHRRRVLKKERPYLRKTYEGVSYDIPNETFIFNFYEDNDNDFIKISTEDIGQIQAEDRVYFYGYKLLSGLDRDNFVSTLKKQMKDYYDGKNISGNIKDIFHFISRAVYFFCLDYGNLYNFKCIIYPDTSNNYLVSYIVDLFNTHLTNNNSLVNYSMTKKCTKDVTFNKDVFLSNNPNVSEKTLKDLEQMEVDFKNSKPNDKFTLHEITKGNINFRQCFYEYLDMSPDCEDTIRKIADTEYVLLVDDTVTTGTTMERMVTNIKNINPVCNIVIFTLCMGVNPSLKFLNI